MIWRSILTASLACICFSAAEAQHLSRAYMQQCNDLFRDLHTMKGCGRPECSTTMDTTYWNSMLREMEQRKWGIWPEKNTYYKDGSPGSPKADSITFSTAEMKYIMDALRTRANAAWDVGNILHSITFLPRQYIDSIERMDKEREPDQREHSTHFYEHFACGTLYHVSHPVFLRKNTICIFYQGTETVLGGSGNMHIYVKTNKGWEAFAELYGFIDG